MQAGKIQLSDNANISAKSTGTNNAGTVSITADSIFESFNSSVTTESTVASGGNITLNASHMVHLVDSKVTTSVAGGPSTAGGNISIDPEFVVLQNSQILAQALAGTGGNITITAGTFMADPSSLVSASSQLGVSGTVDVRAPVQNLSGALVPLTQEYLASPQLLAQRCAARYADGQFSTFVVAAREGTPREPGGYLTSPVYIASAETGIAATERVPDPYIVLAKGLPGNEVKTALGAESNCLAGNISTH
jgi:large exoprotein involved in heme utilization and adhesion